MACLMAEAQRTGFRSWEKTLLAALYVLPLCGRLGGLLLGVTAGPPFAAAMLVLLSRRAGLRLPRLVAA
jgi:uncharacterized membrane protein